MKNIILTVSTCFTICMLPACQNNKDASAKAETQSRESLEKYTCPMHPDITGRKGDKCPKCGMELVIVESKTESMKEHKMNFSIKTPPVAGERVEIQLRPVLVSGSQDTVGLSIQHEKKIHLIIVSDDLSWFDHIHPAETGDGNYSVNEIFPAGGIYHLYADYKPLNGNPVVDKFTATVEGKGIAVKSFTSNKLTDQSGEFSFELRPSQSFIKTGSTVHFTGIVLKKGKEIDAKTLDNYLGAKAHIVTISLKEKKYQHIHPTVGKGRFDLEASFESPGIYRWWIQFMAEGKLHTIDLVTKVEEGATDPGSPVKTDHNGHDH